eukprot:scaffold83165_cov39-Phaeocystis_antarctica.AAC.1
MKGSSIVSKANGKGIQKRTKSELSRNKNLIFSRCAGPQALRALRARRPGEIGRTPGEIAKTEAPCDILLRLRQWEPDCVRSPSS